MSCRNKILQLETDKAVQEALKLDHAQSLEQQQQQQLEDSNSYPVLNLDEISNIDIVIEDDIEQPIMSEGIAAVPVPVPIPVDPNFVQIQEQQRRLVERRAEAFQRQDQVNRSVEREVFTEKTFKCDICGKHLKNSHARASHKNKQHKPGKKCEKCGKEICSHYARHINVCKGNKCKNCGKDFSLSDFPRHKEN